MKDVAWQDNVLLGICSNKKRIPVFPCRFLYVQYFFFFLSVEQIFYLFPNFIFIRFSWYSTDNSKLRAGGQSYHTTLNQRVVCERCGGKQLTLTIKFPLCWRYWRQKQGGCETCPRLETPQASIRAGQSGSNTWAFKTCFAWRCYKQRGRAGRTSSLPAQFPTCLRSAL